MPPEPGQLAIISYLQLSRCDRNLLSIFAQKGKRGAKWFDILIKLDLAVEIKDTSRWATVKFLITKIEAIRHKTDKMAIFENAAPIFEP